MTTSTGTASLETKPISTQVTDRRLIARKATAGKMIAVAIVGKTIAMVVTAKKAIAAVVIVRKAIIMIFGNRMTISDTGMVPTTDRLASTDRIARNLATTRSGRPMLLVAKTISPVPILVMIKMILIPPSICQLPSLMAMRLVWFSASW